MSNAIQTVERPTVTGYDPDVRFYSTRYTQGGRTVFTMDLSLAQIAGLLPAPDPANPQPGNRRIQPAHAAAFGSYIRNNERWVAPAIVLRDTEEYDFEVQEEVAGTQFGIVTVPFLSLSNIHILDGQHRTLGIHMALRGITNELTRAKQTVLRMDKRTVADEDRETYEWDLQTAKNLVIKLENQRSRFERERMAVQVFIEDEQSEYQQMFYDIADNALGITASVRARFDTRKAINRVLQEAIQHPVLQDRVDLEFDRLGRQNTNLLSAKHVQDVIRIQAVGIEGRIGRRVESGLDEDDLLRRTNQFFTMLETFTQIKELEAGDVTALDLRSHSMVASPVMIRVLAGVFAELRKRGMSLAKIKSFFQHLEAHLSHPADKAWVKNTGGELFFVGALSPTSRRQDLVELTGTMAGWAESYPDWLGK